MWFYSDTSPRTGKPVDVTKMDGTAAYLRHYANYLFLSFMAKNGTFQEKQEAAKELAICERKLAYWKRHPSYFQDEVTRGCVKLRRQWGESVASSILP